MGKLLAILVMRIVAFVLVNYGLTSVDFAVAITSDPTLFNEVTLGASALVVMLTEELSKRIGSKATGILLGILPRFIQRFIDRLTIPKTPKN